MLEGMQGHDQERQQAAETNAREEQLLRVIGEERAAHPPKLVAAAERELARRAGTTRGQALGRVHGRAIVLMLSGLYILVLAAPAAAEAVRMQDIAGRLAACAGIALGVLLGLGFGALGLGLLLRNRWVARDSRRLPFACAQAMEVADYDPDTASLLALIGSDRQAAPPDSVSAAERELRGRLARGNEATRSRVTSWGKACVLFGVLAPVQVMAMGGLAIVVADGGAMKARGGLFGAPASGLLLLSVFFCGFLVGATGGALILLAGLKLRSARRGGCKDLVRGMWTWLAGWTAFPLVALLTVSFDDKVRRSQALAGAAIPILASLLWGMTCALVFWRCTRVLCRPEVREVCGVETPMPEGL